jgi:hypothetical protein
MYLITESQDIGSNVNDMEIENNQSSNKIPETSVFITDAKAMYNSDTEITVPLPSPYEVQVFLDPLCRHAFFRTSLCVLRTHIDSRFCNLHVVT